MRNYRDMINVLMTHSKDTFLIDIKSLANSKNIYLRFLIRIKNKKYIYAQSELKNFFPRAKLFAIYLYI